MKSFREWLVEKELNESKYDRIPNIKQYASINNIEMLMIWKNTFSKN